MRRDCPDETDKTEPKTYASQAAPRRPAHLDHDLLLSDWANEVESSETGDNWK